MYKCQQAEKIKPTFFKCNLVKTNFIKLVLKKYRSGTGIELKVSVSKMFERYPALHVLQV